MMTTTCPHCGKPVPASAPGGLCPECMLHVGASATGEAEPGATIPMRTPSDPPSPEDIAALFPQLEILNCLGRGGMGVVYKARQPKLDRMVALKILLPDTGTNVPDPGFSERFSREARALAQLNHPNIVSVYDFGEAGGHLYLLMEYVDGLNLRQMIRTERLKPDVALAIVPRICDALQYAHEQGVIHRDIKPENILVDPAGRVKIADFGIAKILRQRPGEDALTREHHVMGTPHYMAPEQVEHPLSVDHRADIYSLGVVFYEMLTGELPLGKFAPPSRKVNVDVRLDEVVLHALEKEPARRYQHASEVKTDLDGISRGPATPAADAPTDRRRRPSATPRAATTPAAGAPVRPRRGPLYWVVTLLLGGFGLLILLSVLAIAVSIALPAFVQSKRAPAAGSANVAAQSGPREFGPVREVTLAGEGDAQQRFFDLDRQQSYASTNFFALGSEPGPAESAAVLQKYGIDLVADTAMAMEALIGFNMVTIPVHTQEWDMPPARFAYFLNPASTPTPAYIMPANPKSPATFVFRTAEGAEGVLQIAGVKPDADPPTISLRYKLTQPH